MVPGSRMLGTEGQEQGRADTDGHDSEQTRFAESASARRMRRNYPLGPRSSRGFDRWSVNRALAISASPNAEAMTNRTSASAG